MRLHLKTFAALTWLSVSHCALHHLIVSTFAAKNLYTLEFDDIALDLKLVAKQPAKDASAWIALSVRPLPFPDINEIC